METAGRGGSGQRAHARWAARGPLEVKAAGSSVRAAPQQAAGARLMKALAPLSTQSPPSRLALVLSEAASEPLRAAGTGGQAQAAA